MKRILVTALLSLAFAAPVAAAVYNIDPNHTQVQFTYNHFGYSNMTGRFAEVTGAFDFDAADPAKSTIEVQLPINSVSTGFPKLDDHLKSEDFFDAAKFPIASFKSTKVDVLGKDTLSVTGDLTIHGVTKPVVLDVHINSTAMHPMRKVAGAGFDASTTIKRSEFGIGGMVPRVSDEIRLTISMEAMQPKQ